MTAYLLALLLLQAGSDGEASRVVEMSSVTEDYWGVSAQAQGVATATDREVTVDMKSIKLIANTGKGSHEISQYTVCLAYQKAEKVWDEARCAPEKKLKLSLKDGQIEEVAGSTFKIPRVESLPLDAFWLVIRIDKQRADRKVGMFFAHSKKDALKGLHVSSRD